MRAEQALQTVSTRLGDTTLILSQRLTEWVTRGPELEEELANANVALDYLGQARLFYSYAAELEGEGRSEDDFAFLREASAFQNPLLVEISSEHFGDAIARQVLFDTYYLRFLERLCECSDQRLADIARRAVKEVRYHLRHASMWFVRLGDGTEESHRRLQASLDAQWQYTGELFVGDSADDMFRDHFNGPDLAGLRPGWRAELQALASEATLELPEDGWMADGGRRGIHTEGFGYLIAEMQHLPRVHHGVGW